MSCIVARITAMESTSECVSSPIKYITSHSRGNKFSGREKKLILNVYANIRKENPNFTIRKVKRITSTLTGASEKSICRMRSEFHRNSVVKTPKKASTNKKEKYGRLTRLDAHTKWIIRKTVHNFFARNEPPTVAKITAEINAMDDMEHFSKSRMYRTLKDLNFCFKKRGRDSHLMERDDIVKWRHRYIREIRRYRAQQRPIYYLDETWVNAGIVAKKVWRDLYAEKNPRDAFMSGLSKGLKNPKGKGERLIVVHMGSEEGFVLGAFLNFHGKKSSENYHEEMDGERFERWFKEQALPNIKPGSIIVMDNASYHSVRREKLPVKSWRKQQIQEWLTEKQVQWESDMLKVELMAIVQTVKHKYEGYRIDDIAAAAGHKVLRTPPYHCEFNPIELAWSKVKRHVAANNKTFKLRDLKPLLDEGVASVTSSDWKNYVKHVVSEENKMWTLNEAMDGEFIISIAAEDDSDDESLGGIEPMELDDL